MHDMVGQPNIPKATIDRIIAFLERSDISYCKPDRKETVYCGKDLNGESVDKPKHYLLWTLREILNHFNSDEKFYFYLLLFTEDCIRAETYYTRRQDWRGRLPL